ncbi:hypothetical protein B6259_06545 [Ruminococcaceae bacterium CPB6]|jgi:lysophospholipase L1-like esterase|uniref:SGNH hydrolase-type esterase domain-containing protein n=1 Tax=Caproicibacterium lactatifermentans TaxID=2666138 RepID=A0A859DQI7_9FIRM|nr:SGNH/GDSL hydrolase family protein [Caproicibacterium lactatifermentans]ARP50564.1 hypothetical protein B6259_06545 [Ruminococcaceae bacterium CPB6]MDD4807882.1 SGNH/GDSL hydrolase family protein [Oscillospiraceae bacterium]QKN23715.1 hypothetical protein GJQ69_04020 [Caproicibacterium lactatifermentans]
MKTGSDDVDFTNKVIDFLGDSITAGDGVTDEKNIYPNVLKRNIPLAKANNYSVSGTRIAGQLHPSMYPDWDVQYFAERANAMDNSADAVVVFGGTNDFGHGDAPLGSLRDRTMFTFSGACRLLMEQLIRKFPLATIVFMTPLHRMDEDNPRGEGYKKTDYGPLSAYVRIIQEVAQDYAIPVLNLYAVSGIQPKNSVLRENYCPDGLHPNDAGHCLIARRLQGFLGTL